MFTQVLKVPTTCLGRRWEISGSVEVVASTGLSSSRDSSVTFQADSSAAYIIVPHTGWVSIGCGERRGRRATVGTCLLQ